MGVREILGFDVGDLVRFREKRRAYLVWEVAGVDLPRRRLEIRRWMPDGDLVQSTAPPRRLVLVATAEERVAEALMKGTE